MSETKVNPEIIRAHQKLGSGTNKVILDKITKEKLSKSEAMSLVKANERTIDDFIITNFKRKKNGPKRL